MEKKPIPKFPPAKYHFNFTRIFSIKPGMSFFVQTIPPSGDIKPYEAKIHIEPYGAAFMESKLEKRNLIEIRHMGGDDVLFIGVRIQETLYRGPLGVDNTVSINAKVYEGDET